MATDPPLQTTGPDPRLDPNFGKNPKAGEIISLTLSLVTLAMLAVCLSECLGVGGGENGRAGC